MSNPKYKVQSFSIDDNAIQDYINSQLCYGYRLHSICCAPATLREQGDVYEYGFVLVVLELIDEKGTCDDTKR